MLGPLFVKLIFTSSAHKMLKFMLRCRWNWMAFFHQLLRALENFRLEHKDWWNWPPFVCVHKMRSPKIGIIINVNSEFFCRTLHTGVFAFFAKSLVKYAPGGYPIKNSFTINYFHLNFDIIWLKFRYCDTKPYWILTFFKT